MRTFWTPSAARSVAARRVATLSTCSAVDDLRSATPTGTTRKNNTMDMAPPAFDDIDAVPDVCTAAWTAVLLPRLHRYLSGNRIELVRHLGPVCRAWYFAAARAHYHDVTVPSRSKLAALLDSWQPTSSDKSSIPALGSFVRTLRVADIREPSFVTSSDPVNDDWLGQLAAICPNVTRLELDRVQVLSDECLDTLAMRFAPAAAASSKFTGKFSKGKHTTAADPQRPFARLEALALRRCPNLTPRGTRLLLQLLGAIDSRGAWPPNPNLTSLAVVECEYALDHALLVAILHGYNDTPTSSTALPSYQDAVASTLAQWTHLDLSGMTVLFNDPACIDALITAAMAYRLCSLQSLHMAGARIRHPHALPSLLRALPPLTHLDLANTFVPSFPTDESVWATHAPSLTRLNIAGVSAAQRTDRTALAHLLTHVLTTLRDLVLAYTDDVDDDGTAAGDIGLPVSAAHLALTSVESLTVHVRAGPNPCGGLPTQLVRVIMGGEQAGARRLVVHAPCVQPRYDRVAAVMMASGNVLDSGDRAYVGIAAAGGVLDEDAVEMVNRELEVREEEGRGRRKVFLVHDAERFDLL
ncbi:hypothetical protein GGF31_001505 [Allomyces arbusculus]|nr:hypothetical protein GGF31_001505 [Allomyces arbusculus]